MSQHLRADRVSARSGPVPPSAAVIGATAAATAAAAVPACPVGSGGMPASSYGVALLFREHHADLVRLAVLLVGDQPSAEDVVQDVFARLCLRDRLPGGDGSLAYVRAAVLNGCRSALRRRAVVRRFRNSSDPLVRDALQRSAEDEMVLAEDRRQVLAALAALPPRRREVLVLRYWLGLTEAEIASVLGISTGTVKSTAARGLAVLARELGGQV